VWPLPLGGDNATVSFNIEERPEGPSNRPSARMAFATPEYFSTAGIPLLRGRPFTQHDDSHSPRVLIVNQAFANKYFPGEDVIGKRITPGATGPGETKESVHEIVGVVGSAKLFALDAEPQPIYYFPYRQLVWQAPVTMLRTSVAPRALESAIREQVSALDPLVPVFQVRTMDDLLAVQVSEPRFHTLLLACFAGIALLLTMVGLYGLMAYSVTRRTREIGIRMALGASRKMVLTMVLKEVVLLLTVGLVMGLIGALAGDRLLRSMVFGVSTIDLRVIGLSSLIVALTGILAAHVPARRAATVEPTVALRHE
jgi:putative ABC transport system permease protein